MIPARYLLGCQRQLTAIKERFQGKTSLQTQSFFDAADQIT